jgi:hypothetical protein
MTDTGAFAEGNMPTPDMTTVREDTKETMSPREQQKLDVFRQEHPDVNTEGGSPQEGEMPNPGMND